ncbi:MAG: DUF4012 domain-containing protein, partial [Patescibacteria group bacterium]
MQSERVINLRDKMPSDRLWPVVRVLKKRGRKKQLAIKKLQPEARELVRLLASRPASNELIEISYPERENILATLEMIETEYDRLGENLLRQVLIEPEKIAETEINEVSLTLSEQSFEDLLVIDEARDALREEEILSVAEKIVDEDSFSFAVEEIKNEEKISAAPPVVTFVSMPLLKNSRVTFKPDAGWLTRSNFFGRRLLWRGRVKLFAPWRIVARRGVGFMSAGCLIFLVILGLSLAGRGLEAKDSIFSSALQAYQAMLAAKDSAVSLDFSGAQVNLETAYQNFLSAEQELNNLGRGLIYVMERLPGGSVVASGSALIEAGEKLSQAGQNFARVANLFLVSKLGDYLTPKTASLTDKISQAQDLLAEALNNLALANQALGKVKIEDLPQDLAPRVQVLKDKLPGLVAAAGQIEAWGETFNQLLGSQHPKKYLLIFQNNAEARATGGFIGTYGWLDLDAGQIKNLTVNNVFDLDGQLYEKVVPPRPIQKISTAWSTHDANWFADWPSSAKKIMWFFEKAGGATPDGVISFTPTLLERLLALTGPIELPQYQVTLDQYNFLELVQYKVEVDYDKELNQPKRILADFMPLFLERLGQVWLEQSQEVFSILVNALAEKHVLFYLVDQKLQTIFSQQGWTGEVLTTEKDYLSVINTNINGFKTDKVIEQKIYHTASVQADGSVIDTVRVVRAHQGG